MPKIIINPLAPVDTVTISVDNRFVPPEIQLKVSREIPGQAVVKLMAHCIATLMDVMSMQQAAGQNAPAAKDATNGEAPAL
jgi:hypothetical protein